MASLPSSSTARPAEHPICPGCWNKYDSKTRIPMASGIPGCSHNACKPCTEEYAKKISELGIKKCLIGCLPPAGSFIRGNITAVKNTDLVKALDYIMEQERTITAVGSILSPFRSSATPTKTASVVEDVKKLTEQLLAAQNRILELERANAHLLSDVSTLKERIVTASPVVRPFMPMAAPQPQPASSSTDLSRHLKWLDKPPVMAKPSTVHIESTPAASTGVVFTREQMSVLFPSGHKDNVAKMHRMTPSILMGTLMAGSFDYSEYFDLLSDAQLSCVPLSQMTSEQIEIMFPEADGPKWTARYRLRMSKIQLKEIGAALQAGKLEGYLRDYLLAA